MSFQHPFTTCKRIQKAGHPCGMTQFIVSNCNSFRYMVRVNKNLLAGHMIFHLQATHGNHKTVIRGFLMKRKLLPKAKWEVQTVLLIAPLGKGIAFLVCLHITKTSRLRLSSAHKKCFSIQDSIGSLSPSWLEIDLLDIKTITSIGKIFIIKVLANLRPELFLLIF